MNLYKTYPLMTTAYWSLLIVLCLHGQSGWAEEDLPQLDGVYTESRTFIDEEGEETTGIPYDYVVLELQGDRFLYWHFSDRIGIREYPITGTYSLKEGQLELMSDELNDGETYWVVTTIKGVSGIWPKKELKKWQEGAYPVMVPILVKVAQGPMGAEGLNQKNFLFPSITPLLDKEAARKYWAEQKAKHEARYNDVPDPLRNLLRTMTERTDGNMIGYRDLLERQQTNPDPLLVNQLISEIGKGVSIVVGPLTLQDLYALNPIIPANPNLEKNQQTKRKALQILVDALSFAENQEALEAALMVFLKASGVTSIDLTGDNGIRVKLSWNENRKTTRSFKFNESIRDQCQEWAQEQLNNKFGQKR